MECLNCNFRGNKVEIITTEIGQIKWLNSKIEEDGTIITFGDKWEYEGGETYREKGYLIICPKCGEIIKEIKCNC